MELSQLLDRRMTVGKAEAVSRQKSSRCGTHPFFDPPRRSAEHAVDVAPLENFDGLLEDALVGLGRPDRICARRFLGHFEKSSPIRLSRISGRKSPIGMHMASGRRPLGVGWQGVQMDIEHRRRCLPGDLADTEAEAQQGCHGPHGHRSVHRSDSFVGKAHNASHLSLGRPQDAAFRARFFSYMALSALSRARSISSLDRTDVAIPIDAETRTSRPSTRRGLASSSSIRCRVDSATPASASTSRTANSSPPRRTARSEERRHRFRHSATYSRARSPNLDPGRR